MPSAESRQQHGSYKPVVVGNSCGAVGSNITVRGTVTPVFQNNPKQGNILIQRAMSHIYNGHLSLKLCYDQLMYLWELS